MDNDPPLRTGDIVRVDLMDVSGRNLIAKLVRITPGDGVVVKMNSPISEFETRSVALERCFHATESERKEYFKQVLKNG